MLRYTKSLPYLPELARCRPSISEEDKVRAAAEPPLPVPFHCKPWVDGQTMGWTLVYGYRTAVTLRRAAGGEMVAEGLDELNGESGRDDTFMLMGDGLRLDTGYGFCTPAGLVTLLVAANRPVAGLALEVGVLDTEEEEEEGKLQTCRTFHPVTLGFRVVGAAEIRLAAGVELARVVVIPRHGLWQARLLAGEELVALREREAAYRKEEETTTTRWTAATGESFTHLYRVWSRRVGSVKRET
jgi:hypothetical protein